MVSLLAPKGLGRNVIGGQRTYKYSRDSRVIIFSTSQLEKKPAVLNTMPKTRPQPPTPPDLPTPPAGAEKRRYYVAGDAVWYCRERSRSHEYPGSN